MTRRRTAFILVCSMLLVFAYCLVAAAAEKEPAAGQSVGNVKFGKPLSDEDAKYLGLDKAGEFTLKDIKAPYIFIESMNTT